MCLEYTYLICIAAMHRKGVHPSSMHTSTLLAPAVTVMFPWGKDAAPRDRNGGVGIQHILAV